MLSESHEGAGERIDVLVATRKGRRNNHTVDDVREDLDSHLGTDDDERRRGGGLAAERDGLQEIRAVLGDTETDDHDCEEVDSDNTVKDCSDRHAHGRARIVSLSGQHCNRLDAEVRKGRFSEDGPEAEEARLADGLEAHVRIVPWLLAPILAANECVVGRDTTKIGNETEKYKRHQHGDLYASKEELNLAVTAISKKPSWHSLLDAHYVHQQRHDETSGNVSAGMVLVRVPV